MKKLTRALAFLTVLCMCFMLTACGETPDKPDDGDDPSEQGMTASNGVGTYHLEYADEYGDITRFSVKLRENRTFTLMTTVGSLGDNTCNGTEWTVNEDGTITTGATDEVLELDFVEDDGTLSTPTEPSYSMRMVHICSQARMSARALWSIPEAPIPFSD